jgi:DNA-binding LacI/PurR family transcriptional regulator
MAKRHSNPRTISTALGRRQYFMDFRAAKLGHATPEIRAERYNATCGGDSIRAFPQEKPAIDLLTCENDILACGAEDVLTHEFGMRVPQDIAIVGFDNLELSGAPPCDLTTYEQPMDEMAGALVDMILGRRPKNPRHLSWRPHCPAVHAQNDGGLVPRPDHALHQRKSSANLFRFSICTCPPAPAQGRAPSGRA